jgi:GDPmannose 4,6-dehydratase
MKLVSKNFLVRDESLLNLEIVQKVLLEVDHKYYRPAEVEKLLGDPTKARTQLGWNPRKTSFEELVKIMMKHDKEFVIKYKDNVY